MKTITVRLPEALAAQVLGEVVCSILALKSPGFASPVTLEV
jgi:hypothetical protein